MAMSTRERVDTLENALKELAYAGRRTEMAVDRLSQELREFKGEMSDFKDEMVDFKDEMAAFKDENRRKRHPTDRSRRKEFDLIACTADVVFWNETKVGPKMRYLAEFVEGNESIFEFFPELAGKRLVKIASALSMNGEEITYLTKNRCYAMTLGEETMDLVNFEQVGGLD